MSTAAADALARERDAKFKAWLQNKALKDKAFEFLGKLNSQRAIEEESLIEVAISLCAVDRLLGGDEDKKGPNEGMGEEKKDLGTSAKKTLKSAWFRWAMEYHAFNMIHLSDADVAGLSGGVREFLTSESDLIASGGNYGEELERASRTKNILPSLKYFFPAVPKPNEKAKPLTNDQKAQNLIFMREARKLWRKAEDELKNRVTEFVAKTMKAGGKKRLNSQCPKQRRRWCRLRKRCQRACG
mmetsp:Transcript_41699/g.72365  ORF Transcript_41699/g.72365 Transcript_41699/m.72365 type:complete len:242 (+) Transcript_41699:32-757(+)